MTDYNLLLIGVEFDLSALETTRDIVKQKCRDSSVLLEAVKYPLTKSFNCPFLEELVNELESWNVQIIPGDSEELATKTSELCGYVVGNRVKQDKYLADEYRKKFDAITDKRNQHLLARVQQEQPKVVIARTMHCQFLIKNLSGSEEKVIDNRYSDLGVDEYVKDYLKQNMQQYMLQKRMRLMYQKMEGAEKERMKQFLNFTPEYWQHMKKYVKTKS